MITEKVTMRKDYGAFFAENVRTIVTMTRDEAVGLIRRLASALGTPNRHDLSNDFFVDGLNMEKELSFQVLDDKQFLEYCKKLRDTEEK